MCTNKHQECCEAAMFLFHSFLKHIPHSWKLLDWWARRVIQFYGLVLCCVMVVQTYIFFPTLSYLYGCTKTGTDSLILMPVKSLAHSASMWVILFGGRGNGLACLFPLFVCAETTDKPAHWSSYLAKLPKCVLQPAHAGEAVKNVLNCNQMFKFKRI